MEKCLICGKICKSKFGVLTHVRRIHNIPSLKYKKDYNLEPKQKTCSVEGCNKILPLSNTNELCRSHAQTGERNPMFGKKLSTETKNKITQSNIENWKNPEYRNKVITNSSKPRYEGFGEVQSKAITKSYQDNPELRNIRSKQMKKDWENGKIPISVKAKVNRSKFEDEVFEMINSIYCHGELTRETLHIDNKWYYPDILIPDLDLIIECFGDYWHANPNQYKATDIINDHYTAKEIWNHDNERFEKLKNAGYFIEVIWESDWKKRNELVCGIIDEIFDY